MAGRNTAALRRGLTVAGAALVFAGLYLSSRHSYLLFHNIAELFSIVVACAMFLLAWNARRIMADDFLLFLGIAYLSVAGIDLLHTLAYTGMNIFAPGGSNLPTQLWIAGRYLEAGSICLAPIFLKRKLRPGWTLAVFLTLCSLLVLSIFRWPVFPTTYVEGQGLTPFKILSEYVICGVLAGALYFLYRRRGSMDPRVFRLLTLSVCLTIVSELAFTEYVSVYGFFNLFGHFLKILSYYFVYRAIIVVGLTTPYEVLFRGLKQREERLAESEHRYRILVELSPDGVAVEAEGRLLYLNTAAGRLWGAGRPEELLEKLVLELVDPASQELLSRMTGGAGEASGRILPALPEEARLRRLDGQSVDVEVSGAPIAYDGKPADLLVFRDITERRKTQEALIAGRDQLEQRVRERTADYAAALEALKEEVGERIRAEEALQESSRLLEAFFKHTFTPLVFLDKEFNFVRVNEAYARACQRDAADFPGRNHFELYPSDAKEIFEEVVRTRKPFKTLARPFRFPDHPEWGVSYWDWELFPLLDEEGEVEFLVFVLEDVTQRTESAAKLNELNDALEERARQLQLLAEELLQAEQRERRRIALVLHDHLQQLLVGAKLKVSLMSGEMETEGLRDSAQRLGALLQESIDVSRTLSVELCPPSLYRAGLTAALRWLGDWMQEKHGLSVAVEAEEGAEAGSEAINTLLFQSVRELLFNVAKHAGVSRAAVTMERVDQERLRIAVRDEGAGFDFSAVRRSSAGEAGLGLFSIRERLDLVGGSITVESFPGQGSRITLEAPLQAP